MLYIAISVRYGNFLFIYIVFCVHETRICKEYFSALRLKGSNVNFNKLKTQNGRAIIRPASNVISLPSLLVASVLMTDSYHFASLSAQCLNLSYSIIEQDLTDSSLDKPNFRVTPYMTAS